MCISALYISLVLYVSILSIRRESLVLLLHTEMLGNELISMFGRLNHEACVECKATPTGDIFMDACSCQ